MIFVCGCCCCRRCCCCFCVVVVVSVVFVVFAFSWVFYNYFYLLPYTALWLSNVKLKPKITSSTYIWVLLYVYVCILRTQTYEIKTYVPESATIQNTITVSSVKYVCVLYNTPICAGICSRIPCMFTRLFIYIHAKFTPRYFNYKYAYKSCTDINWKEVKFHWKLLT